jgi:hypothetical protein
VETNTIFYQQVPGNAKLPELDNQGAFISLMDITNSHTHKRLQAINFELHFMRREPESGHLTKEPTKCRKSYRPRIFGGNFENL